MKKKAPNTWKAEYQKKITVTLEAEQVEQLRKMARAAKYGQSAVVNMAIEQLFKKHVESSNKTMENNHDN